ncbi:sensor histidine kinase [Azospirillum thermophilum]|uniref:sensor histidine kinase n=1 Tax=Azospirillum thermophilum TaxID=2202148 RepID=UPI001FEA9F69|nr:PAS domain-containing sensor histidine kinase [Azospirillum thermophilum]
MPQVLAVAAVQEMGVQAMDDQDKRRAGGGAARPDDPNCAGKGAAGEADLLRSILEQSPAPTAVLDPDGRTCLFANAALRAIGGLAGPDFPERFPAVPAGLLAAARRIGQGQGDRTTDAEGRRWDVQVTPILGVAGTVRALLVTLRDLPPTQAEHDAQLREVSHRVKNTLQLVSSLLTLQALSTREPEIRRAFQSAGGRIGMVTQAHQRTHKALRRSHVDFAEHLRELCAELESGMLGGQEPRRIRVEAEPVDLPVDSVIPLTLIVYELISNALRHAYVEGDPGEVEVTLRHRPDGLRLTVVDRGRGLPPGLDVARATTLGLKVVRAFAGQLKGRVRAEPAEPGTRMILDIPA